MTWLCAAFEAVCGHGVVWDAVHFESFGMAAGWPPSSGFRCRPGFNMCDSVRGTLVLFCIPFFIPCVADKSLPNLEQHACLHNFPFLSKMHIITYAPHMAAFPV